jgi:cytochrome bd-type quinol oxidase subunit 1
MIALSLLLRPVLAIAGWAARIATGLVAICFAFAGIYWLLTRDPNSHDELLVFGVLTAAGLAVIAGIARLRSLADRALAAR